MKLVMTISDALVILEDATSHCKQRDVYTPEVRQALDFLQPRIRPEWLIPHFRYHAQLNDKNEIDLDKKHNSKPCAQSVSAFVKQLQAHQESNPAAIHIEAISSALLIF